MSVLPKNTRFRLPRLVGQLWGTTNSQDILSAARYFLGGKQLVKGPAIATYEQEFAHRVGVRHAISLASGRVALFALLKEMGIGAGDEVLLQVPTHIVVANAIRYAGAKPVYVDCALDTYNMDLNQAEQRITARTRVLLIQHTFGIPVNMDEAMALAKRYDLILIEDCVHALGATYRHQPVGSFSQAAFFSTEETKMISSIMGGMAVTNDDLLAQGLRAFQKTCQWPSPTLVRRYLSKLIVNHLLGHPYVHHLTRPVYLFLRKNPRMYLAPGATSSAEMAGQGSDQSLPPNYKMRLSNAQAALALRQLRRLDANLTHRRLVAEIYRRMLAPLGLRVPDPPENSQPSYVRYPIWVGNRAEAMRAAAPHAVLGQWFNTVLEESIDPQAGLYLPGSCPNAEAAAEHLVNLPTHPRVHREDIVAIVHALSQIQRGDPAPTFSQVMPPAGERKQV